MTSHVRGLARAALSLGIVALSFWSRGAVAEGKPLAGVKVVPNNSGGGGASTSASPQLKQGTITLGDDSGKPGTSKLVPPTHTVKKGDTLWDICDSYFGNPWQWPRVWSYNPEILNPHWIYPGELVRLKKDAGIAYSKGAGTGAGANGGAPKPGMSLKPKLVPTGTVFLQNQGFIYDSDVEAYGEVTGSPEDKMLLSAPDRMYVRLTDQQAKSAAVGDTMTIFKHTRPVKNADGTTLGTVVQILGTAKLTFIDKDKKVAEAVILDSRDVIERGDARVGPLDRKLDVVPAATNEVELSGQVLESVHENQMFGSNQVVFIDKGEKAGLKVGNRLFVVVQGDPWQQGLSSTGAYTASKVTLSTDGPADVDKAQAEESKDYPEEVIAELRVVRVRKESATCLVMRSTREILPGFKWKAQKGY